MTEKNVHIVGFIPGTTLRDQVRLNDEADPMMFPDRFSSVPRSIQELVRADEKTANIYLTAQKVERLLNEIQFGFIGSLGISITVGYPHRLVGDIDILVLEEDFEKTKRALLCGAGVKQRNTTSVTFPPNAQELEQLCPGCSQIQSLSRVKVDVFSLSDSMLKAPGGFSKQISLTPIFGAKSDLLGFEFSTVDLPFLLGAIGSQDKWKDNYDKWVLRGSV